MNDIPYPSHSNSKPPLSTLEEKAANQLVDFLTFCLLVLVFHNRVMARQRQLSRRCCLCPCPFYSQGAASLATSPKAAALQGRQRDRGEGQGALFLATFSFPLSEAPCPGCQSGCVLCFLFPFRNGLIFFIHSLIFYCFWWMKREKLVLKNI